MSVARELGRYRIGERIGSGGVADVYRAEVEGAAGFATTVVVKCLRPHVADEPELVEGLAREAKLARRLQHGNIVQVFDFGMEDGLPYVVMEHVDGCSLHELLRDLLRRGERLGLPEALFVVEELAAALRHAHDLTDDDGTPLSIVHRDVKPRNVLVSRHGVVKLTDFGIAKVADDHSHTLPGVVKGTPAYLSPEQARGRAVDRRTDVFALGLVLGELVLDDGHTGGEPAADPRADDALRSLVETATADDPDARFEDADAMLRALQRWRSARSIDAGPGRLAELVRRSRHEPRAARPVALDAVLLGGAEHEPTDPATAHATSTAAMEPAAPLHWGWMGLAATFAVGAVVWVATMEPRHPAEPAATASVRAAADQGTRHGAAPSPEPQPLRAEATTLAEPDVEALPTPQPANAETTTLAEPDAEALPTSQPTGEPTPDADADAAAEAEVEVEVPSASPRDRPPRSPRPAPSATPGRLQVNVLPWAEVRIDGRHHGRVPVDIELPPGPHRVELSNPQLGRVIKEVELRPGAELEIKEW